LNFADRAIVSPDDSGSAACPTLVSAEALSPAIDAIAAVEVTVAVAGAADIYADSDTSGASTHINILCRCGNRSGG